MNDHFGMPVAKRQKISGAEEARRRLNASPSLAVKSPEPAGGMDEPSPTSYPRGHEALPTRDGTDSRRESESAEPGASIASPAIAKPKRVRTGCLTCRNRHLKCDEAMPVCMNCQKSNRKCERGVRLNFIDLKVEQPPYLLPRVDWKVQFQDESRQIASEYVGGLARYAKLGPQVATPPLDAEAETELKAQRPALPHMPSHFVDNHRATHAQPASSLYYPGTLPRLHEPTYPPYEDQLGSHSFARKSSDPFMTTGSGQTPASSHSGGIGRVPSYGLAASGHDPYGLRGEEAPQPFHGYKTSVSSVASSLVPQGVAASSSGSLRHPTGSGAPDLHEGLMTPQSEKNGERDYLNSPEEIHYMQVFIEEVAIWMDSLDNQKHFARVIPYLALKSPMLMNAFLACGVKHLTLVDGGSYKDDKALYYYDTATTQLLRSLQNPERDTAECATTAVVLNVYEIMSEKPAARMNHIAGARALIRECKWDARSTGIGAACFWLNVGMEVLSCLAFNWATAWDPDQWGIDPEELMSMGPDATLGSDTTASHIGARATDDITSQSTSNIAGVGDEEIWIHRILYVVAKVANFRANIPQFQEPSPHDEQARLQSRFAEWQRLKNWCDRWNAHCPRSLRPYGYLYASSTKSTFPNVWLINRPAIVGRLFYHTAMCLLAQMNPLKPAHHHEHADEIRTVQLHHAHQVCGIVAHTKDNGVASVAIRSLAIAGALLTNDDERREVVTILTSIYRATGWDLQRVHSELKRAWGWGEPAETTPALPQPAVIATSSQGGTLGAAAVMTQLFGMRAAKAAGAASSSNSGTQDTPSANNSHHHYSPGPLHPPARPTGPGSMILPRPGSVTAASPSNHTSPAATAHTPASVASAVTTNNAGTPPSVGSGVSSSASNSASNSRPKVNPLLAQADFTQPNHPYREWYKPPERSASSTGSGNSGNIGAGGLWPY